MSSLHAMISLPTIPLQASSRFGISLGFSELQAALLTLPDAQESFLSPLEGLRVSQLQLLPMSNLSCPHAREVSRQGQPPSPSRSVFHLSLLKGAALHSSKTQILPIINKVTEECERTEKQLEKGSQDHPRHAMD